MAKQNKGENEVVKLRISQLRTITESAFCLISRPMVHTVSWNPNHISQVVLGKFSRRYRLKRWRIPYVHPKHARSKQD